MEADKLSKTTKDYGDFLANMMKEIMESQQKKEIENFVKQLITDMGKLLPEEFQKRTIGEKIPEKISEVVKYIEEGKIPPEYLNKIPGITSEEKADYLISNALLLNTNILIKLFLEEKSADDESK